MNAGDSPANAIGWSPDSCTAQFRHLHFRTLFKYGQHVYFIASWCLWCMELCTTLPFSHVSDRKAMAGQSGAVHVTPLLTCVRQEGQLITLLILSVLPKKQEFLRLLLFNSSHLRPFYFSWFDLKNSDSSRKINFLWDKLFLFFLLYSAIFFFCKNLLGYKYDAVVSTRWFDCSVIEDHWMGTSSYFKHPRLCLVLCFISQSPLPN